MRRPRTMTMTVIDGNVAGESATPRRLPRIPLIDQVPRIGHAGCRIAFLDPSATEGCLIELAELPKHSSHA